MHIPIPMDRWWWCGGRNKYNRLGQVMSYPFGCKKGTVSILERKHGNKTRDPPKRRKDLNFSRIAVPSTTVDDYGVEDFKHERIN